MLVPLGASTQKAAASKPHVVVQDGPSPTTSACTSTSTGCCQGFITIPAHESPDRHIHGSTISSARLGNSLPRKHPSRAGLQSSTGVVENPPSGALQVPSTKLLCRTRNATASREPRQKIRNLDPGLITNSHSEARADTHRSWACVRMWTKYESTYSVSNTKQTQPLDLGSRYGV